MADNDRVLDIRVPFSSGVRVRLDTPDGQTVRLYAAEDGTVRWAEVEED